MLPELLEIVWMPFSWLPPAWMTGEDVFLVEWLVVAFVDMEEVEDPLTAWLPILLVLQVEELTVTVAVAVVLQAAVIPEVGHGLWLLCLVMVFVTFPVSVEQVEEGEEVDGGAAEADKGELPVHRDEPFT